MLPYPYRPCIALLRNVSLGKKKKKKGERQSAVRYIGALIALSCTLKIQGKPSERANIGRVLRNVGASREDRQREEKARRLAREEGTLSFREPIVQRTLCFGVSRR